MRVYGRNSLRGYDDEIDLSDVDNVVLEFGKNRWVEVSLYRARIDGRIEVRASRTLLVKPRASNVIEVEDEQ